MVSKATGVIMTTMKLKIQFADVDSPLLFDRIRRGTTSAGYSQVIPSQPKHRASDSQHSSDDKKYKDSQGKEP